MESSLRKQRTPKKRVAIIVSKGDIQKGQLQSTRECPIALAARRRFKDESLIVSSTAIYSRRKRKRLAVLPMSARDFIKAFDTGLPVSAFSFTIGLTE